MIPQQPSSPGAPQLQEIQRTVQHLQDLLQALSLQPASMQLNPAQVRTVREICALAGRGGEVPAGLGTLLQQLVPFLPVRLSMDIRRHPGRARPQGQLAACLGTGRPVQLSQVGQSSDSHGLLQVRVHSDPSGSRGFIQIPFTMVSSKLVGPSLPQPAGILDLSQQLGLPGGAAYPGCVQLCAHLGGGNLSDVAVQLERHCRRLLMASHAESLDCAIGGLTLRFTRNGAALLCFPEWAC